MTMIPRTGKKVRGSTTGQPIMVLFDVLSRRWATGILWQLQNGPLTFRALQAACDDASPTVLNTRLKELRSVKLVEHDKGGYMLTPTGTELISHIMPLGKFARDWVKTY